MSPADQKELVRFWYERILSGSVATSGSGSPERGRVERGIAEIFASDYRNNMVPAPVGGWKRGPDGARQVVMIYRSSFPDLAIHIEDQMIAERKVTTRYIVTATHTGRAFFGLPATGGKYRVTATGIDLVENGKIAESWGNWDSHELMRQMGILPAGADVG